MNKTIIAHNSLEMEEIGIDLASMLTDGIVVSLVGPLGAGKTTMVKGIAKGLLITDIVVSPSYLLARDYFGQLALHHLDAYRINSLKELVEVGLDQFLPPAEGVTVIEWPNRIKGIVEISDIVIRIALLEDGKREVAIARE